MAAPLHKAVGTHYGYPVNTVCLSYAVFPDRSVRGLVMTIDETPELHLLRRLAEGPVGSQRSIAESLGESEGAGRVMKGESVEAFQEAAEAMAADPLGCGSMAHREGLFSSKSAVH